MLLILVLSGEKSIFRKRAHDRIKLLLDVSEPLAMWNALFDFIAESRLWLSRSSAAMSVGVDGGVFKRPANVW